VRMFSGKVRVRERLNGGPDKVTAIRVFDKGAWVRRDAVEAGEIGKLWGLAHMKVGDAVGSPRSGAAPHSFAPPALEAVVMPVRHEDHVALRSALTQLAEQDPMIDVRLDERQLAVSLYGEVQKEVIQATLAQDFGIDVTFRETTPLCVERPIGMGEAMETLNAEANPFRATIGLRIGPSAPGTGIGFTLLVDYRSVPLFVYRTMGDFAANMEQYVRDALREGLYGWPVSDCTVVMTRSNYSSPDGPPATRGPLSTAADFRKLTPIVVMRALHHAGTRVCEPMSRVRIDAPAGTLGALLQALSKLGSAVGAQTVYGTDVTVEAVLPTARVQELHRGLPGLTGGEGVLESAHAGYEPVRGEPPQRLRTTANPLNRKEYLASLSHVPG